MPFILQKKAREHSKKDIVIMNVCVYQLVKSRHRDNHIRLSLCKNAGDVGGGKALGMGEYLKREGIDRSETMAFGDGENDLTMLQMAGLGVAMENACAEAKAAADIVAPSCDEDGVAQMIEKICL